MQEERKWGLLKRFCDLHTHSIYSDGTFTPREIIDEAVASNLSAVALTDHNTIAGLSDFLNAANDKDILAIAGVEISTGYKDRELHIVGLYLEQSRFAAVENFLKVINDRKTVSNRNLITALQNAGFELDYDEILQKHPGMVNRAVIAAEMVDKGYISSISEGFRGILSSKNGLYVPPARISALDAIAFLRSVHAVPVLAHPFVSLEESELMDFLKEAVPYGLAAMETRYSSYSPQMTQRAREICEEFGILESGGSDFHGNNKPEISLGIGKGTLEVPSEFEIALRNFKRNDRKSDFA